MAVDSASVAEDDVADSVRQFLARAFPDDDPATPFSRPVAEPRGWSNRVFRTQRAGVDYYLRLPGPDPVGLRDPRGELDAWHRAVAAGVARAPLFLAPDTGAMVTRAIDGPDLTEMLAAPAAARRRAIAALGETLGRLQAAPPPTRPRSRSERAARRIAWLQARGVALDGAVLDAQARRSPARDVFTHNDAIPENVVFAEQVFLLDFETAAAGDGTLDLVHAARAAGLETKETAALFEAAGRPLPTPTVLRGHHRTHALDEYLWAAVRIACGDTRPGVREQHDRCLSALRKPGA